MIRIDLGKSDRKQGQGLRKLAVQLKLEQPYDQLLKRFDNDFSRMVAFLVAVAVSVLPYLLVGEYERVVTQGYERKITAMDKELTVVNAEIEGLQPFKRELDSYETQKAQVNQRLAVIHQLVEARGTPVTTLDAVSQSLPETAWLDTVTFESTKSLEKIVLSGRSLTNEDISDFMDRLTQSSYLKNVKLNSVDSATVGQKEVRAFSIDLDIQTPGAAVAVVPK